MIRFGVRPVWAIIRAVNEPRQRTAHALLAAFIALGGLAAGCQARGSVEAVQTAVVAAQTATTAVSGALGNVQSQLGGAALEVTTSPDGAEGDAVTDVSIVGTDVQGNLAKIDSRARQAAAVAALALMSQNYPNATIALNVVDGSGTSLVRGTKAPGQPPAVQ
jgi:hypothetical protein